MFWGFGLLFGFVYLHRRLDLRPVGGGGTTLDGLPVPDADVLASLVDDITTAVAPVVLAIVVKAVQVGELLDGVAGRYRLCHSLRLESLGGSHGLDHGLDHGLSDGLSESLLRLHLGIARSLCLLSHRTALLPLRRVRDRARLRGRVRLCLLCLAVALHLRALGLLPAGESLEDLAVEPEVVGLLLLEERAELLSLGSGRLVVRVRLLDQRADTLCELDPDICLLRLGIGILHLLCLDSLHRRAVKAELSLQAVQLGLEVGNRAADGIGVDAHLML